jgi:Tol biopolymer transport system component
MQWNRQASYPGVSTLAHIKYSFLFPVLLIAPCTYAQATPPASAPPVLVSRLQTIGIEAGSQPITVYSERAHFEAPNWTRDGKSLLFDEAGKIMRISASGGSPSPVDTESATQCNGSHGLSPDGALLAISCSSAALPGSRIYIVPSTGGTPRLVTEQSGAYWHSWSPDGSTLIFTRPQQGSLNIYSIAADGHAGAALTSGTGINDDPDFSPDGKYIYFNSDRSGSMEIWRMHPDGTSPEQITFDDFVNWTAHVSPDGNWMVFLSYPKGTAGHPANQKVTLRLMSLNNRKVRVLTSLIGGSGTINVPSWAPDSRHLAFVSYDFTTSK